MRATLGKLEGDKHKLRAAVSASQEREAALGRVMHQQMADLLGGCSTSEQ